MSHPTLEQVRAAKRRAREIFSRLAHVTGVGVTREEGQYRLKINLRSAPADGTVLPEEVDGIPVRVEITGPIRGRDEGADA